MLFESQKYLYIFRYALAWAFIVLILSGLPGKSIPTLSFHAEDKVGHFVVYAILNFLSLSALRKHRKDTFINVSLVVIACIAWGFCMELLQKYVFKDRSFDYMDALANTIGVLIALLIYVFLKIFGKQSTATTGLSYKNSKRV